jgi:hypothetical protein
MNIAKKKVLFVKTLKFERPSVNVFKNGIFVLTDDGTKMSQTFCIWKVLPAKKGATFTFLPYLQILLDWPEKCFQRQKILLICYTISDEVKKCLIALTPNVLIQIIGSFFHNVTFTEKNETNHDPM